MEPSESDRNVCYTSRPTRVIEADGGSVARTVLSSYDHVGNLRTVTLSGSASYEVVTTHAYDELHRRTKTIEADGSSVARTATFAYDPAGYLTLATTGIGSNSHIATTRTVTDGAGRVTEVIEADGTPEARVSRSVYNLLGQTLFTTSGIASQNGKPTTVATGYDGLHRATRVTEAFGSPWPARPSPSWTRPATSAP